MNKEGHFGVAKDTKNPIDKSEYLKILALKRRREAALIRK